MIKNKFVYYVCAGLRKLGVKKTNRQNPFIKDMYQAIKSLDQSAIVFNIVVATDGSWTAESTNLGDNAIVTGGNKTDKMAEQIRDAIFTHFDIPPSLCDNNLFNLSNQKIGSKAKSSGSQTANIQNQQQMAVHLSPIKQT